MLYVCRIHKILKENIYYLLKHSVHYFSFFRFRYSQFFRALDRRARSIYLTQHPLISSEEIERIFEHRPIFFDKRSRGIPLVESRETVSKFSVIHERLIVSFLKRERSKSVESRARKRNENFRSNPQLSSLCIYLCRWK